MRLMFPEARFPMTLSLRHFLLLGAAALTAGCFQSETKVVTPEMGVQLEGVSAGVYCHADTSQIDDKAQIALPSALTTAPKVSESMGENKCRDLSWSADISAYVDARSKGTVFRPYPMLPELDLLQFESSAGMRAYYLPLAAVDGLILAYDGQSEWPADKLAAAGVAKPEGDVLTGATEEQVMNVLKAMWPDILAEIRADISFTNQADKGPRLAIERFREGHYIFYAREDWMSDPAKMEAAMRALAAKLGLKSEG